MPVKSFSTFLLFLLLIVPSGAYAGEHPAADPQKKSTKQASEPSTDDGPDGEVVRLGEIVVRAAPLTNPTTPVTTRYGTQYNIVTQEQIREQNGPDFQSALRDVPGVMFQSKNLMGSQTSHSLYIRGRGASHPSSDFAILYDDVPRYGALFGQVLGDGIALSTIGGIEIFKSPQPSEFGSGYASVNVKPKYLREEGREIVIDVSGGSYDTFWQSLSAGLKKGPYDVYASQSWASSGGHRAHSRAQQQSYYVNTGYAVTDHWTTRFLANYTGSQTLAPLPETTPATTNGVSWPMAERFDTGTFLATLTLNHRYDHINGYFKAYVNDTDFDLLQELNKGVRYGGGSGGLSSRQHILLYGIRLKEKGVFWPGGEIIFGADLDLSELKNTQKTESGLAVPGINGGLAQRVWNFPKTTVLSPYVAVSQMLGLREGLHATPSAGYRHLHHSEFQSASSYQAGLVVGYAHTDLNVNYARGVNYPSPIVLMNMVLSSAPIAHAGDYWKNIKPETVDHYEMGLQHAWPQRASVSATVFYDHGKDRYQAYLFGPIPVSFNDPIGKYVIRGLELTGTVKPFKAAEIFAGATFMDAKATGGDGIEQNHMPYTPGFQFQAGVQWSFWERFRLALDMQYLQDVYAGTNLRSGTFNYGILTDDNKLENFTLVNGRLGYAFDYRPLAITGSEVYIAVNNIFNRHCEYAKGYSMPGITVFAGLTLKFRV